MDEGAERPRFERLQRLFAAALALPPAKREAFLRQQAGNDPALAAAALELLRAAATGGNTIDDLVTEMQRVADITPERGSSFDPLPQPVEVLFYDALLGADAAAVDGRIVRLCADEPRHARAIEQRAAHFRSREFLAADGEDLLRRLRKIWAPSRHEQRYEHVHDLGEGGFGAVSVVRDRLLGRKVARKTLRMKWGTALHRMNPVIGHRFLDEAQVGAQLLHPGIPLLHDVGVTPLGVPFFTMRLIRGETLDDVITKHHRRDPAWPRDRVLRLVLDVADAVDYAHGEKVLHRDLKTLNVLVGRFGETCVLDWGLSQAHRLQSIRRESAGVVVDRAARLLTSGVGSPGFTAPEQWEGQAHAGCDVFSLGAMLHVVLFGLPPPRITVSSHYRLPHCERRSDRLLFALCERSIAADPLRRFRTMREFRDALAGCLERRGESSIWQRVLPKWARAKRGREAARRPADAAWQALQPAPADVSLVRAVAAPPAQGREADPRIALDKRLEVVRSLGVDRHCFDEGTWIGQGGLAIVTRHVDSRLGRTVAIKSASVARDTGDSWTNLVGRSLEEPQIAAQLDHPSVLSPHDIGVGEDGVLFVVQPFIPSGDLGRFIADHGPEGWRSACRLLLQAARALAHAHERGVIHRDIKPMNILLGHHGDAYLGDWGLAMLRSARRDDSEVIVVQRGQDFADAGRRSDNLDLDSEGTVVGTPPYMSPEQARADHLEPSSDVHSLGCSLFQILTGQTRHSKAAQPLSLYFMLSEAQANPHPKVASRNPRAPRHVAAVCDRAIEFEARHRFTNAGEFALALEDALARTR